MVLIQRKSLLILLNIQYVSASLVVTPYYNKPSQDGLYLHFKKIADVCKDLPVYLYNIPGRSIVKINSDIVKKLSRFKI